MAQKSDLNTNDFLKTIRKDSNYPTFRTFIAVMTFLIYLLAAVFFVHSANTLHISEFLLPFITTVTVVLVGKFLSEVSLMVVDIADSSIFTASKQNAVNRNSQVSE